MRPGSYSNEQDLLQHLRMGSTAAFEQLYHTYSPQLYGNIFRMVKSGAIAEEILQDLFQRVWEKRAGIDPEKAFKSYLFTIAKHLVYDFFHQRSRQQHVLEHLIAVSSGAGRYVDDAVDFHETDSILQNAIHKLPPQRKLVYTLCKIEGRSYEDVGQLLGISVSTISDHIVKATKFLKTQYASEHIIVLVAASIIC